MHDEADLREYQVDALEAVKGETSHFKSLVMPTGSGKTRVALKYANSQLDDGKSVAYITDTDAHAEQVIREANLIGVDVAQIKGSQSEKSSESDEPSRDRRIEDYNLGFHVGLFSYNGYFLGKGVPPAQVLIIDDAHAVVGQQLSHSTVEIDRHEWDRRFEDVLDIIKEANPSIADRIGGLQYPVHREGDAILVPPPATSEAAEALKSRITSISDGTGWNRHFLRRRLDASPDFIHWPCVVSRDSITWRPFVLPFESFGQKPHQEIDENDLLLLTSTQGSEDFLQYRLGLPGTIHEVETDKEMPEMGTRIVIPYPDIGSYSPPSNAHINIIEQWVERFESVLVSVSSDAAHARLASELKSEISTIRYQGDQSIDDFETLQSPRVLILVNRPSGIDIRSSVCNVGIHLDLPYSTSGHESIAGEVESSGNVAEASLAVRLSQLLGRLNRHPDDRSVHLILAGDLPLSRGSIFVNSLDPAVLLDILIGRRGIKREFSLPTDEELIEEVANFLSGDNELRAKHVENQKLARERYLQGGQSGFSPGPDRVVSANLSLARGNFTKSAKEFEELARDADTQGFPAEASYFDFQATCSGLVDDVRAHDVFGRDVDALIDRALERNPPSDSLIGAFRQLKSHKEPEKEESRKQLTEMKLKKEGLIHYQQRVDEYEEEIGESDLSKPDVWTDFWREWLTSPDHEELLDSYIDLFQLLGTDTPRREIENNDARVQWEVEPGKHSKIALEVKGWNDEARESPSQLKVDDIVQARDNAQNIDADSVLLVSSRKGYEREVPTKAEQRDVTYILHETAIALADRLAEPCSTLHRVDTGAKSIDDITFGALYVTQLLKDYKGEEIPASEVRNHTKN